MGGADIPATGVLVAVAGASSSEPVMAPDLGPTLEQARILADEQREREFRGFNRARPSVSAADDGGD